jgi:hypothetical protein
VAAAMPANAPSARYEIRTEFRAPLEFAFRWCTDYSTDDARLEKETFQRRVLRRTKKNVVYEDLDTTPEGWMWSRWSVRLDPPGHWHGESIGNYRTWSIDYRLRSLPDGRTEFRMTGQRRPVGLARRNPSKRAMEANLRTIWKNFGKALEADYRKSRR